MTDDHYAQHDRTIGDIPGIVPCGIRSFTRSHQEERSNQTGSSPTNLNTFNTQKDRRRPHPWVSPSLSLVSVHRPPGGAAPLTGVDAVTRV